MSRAFPHLQQNLRRSLRIGALLASLLCATPLPASAGVSPSSRCDIRAHQGRWRMDLERTTTGQALRTLAAAAGATMYFEGELLDEPVTTQVAGLSLYEAVEALSSGQSFAIAFEKGRPTIWVFGKSSAAPVHADIPMGTQEGMAMTEPSEARLPEILEQTVASSQVDMQELEETFGPLGQDR